MAKNTKPNVFGARKTPTQLKDLFSGLYTTENINSYLNRMHGDYDANYSYLDYFNDPNRSKIWEEMNMFSQAKDNPLGGQLNDDFSNTGIGTTTRLAGNWIRDHKLKSAGLGLGIGANLAGLFDNPNIAGQLVGGAGAGLGANLLAKHFGKPLTASGTALWALGGGALGSLFDKLMYKKQQEQQAQLYGGY